MQQHNTRCGMRPVIRDGTRTSTGNLRRRETGGLVDTSATVSSVVPVHPRAGDGGRGVESRGAGVSCQYSDRTWRRARNRFGLPSGTTSGHQLRCAARSGYSCSSPSSRSSRLIGRELSSAFLVQSVFSANRCAASTVQPL